MPLRFSKQPIKSTFNQIRSGSVLQLGSVFRTLVSIGIPGCQTFQAPFRNDDKVHSEFFSAFQEWQRRAGKEELQELPTFAAETVDAIIVMAKALSETPADQQRNGTAVVERLRSISFDGVSGRVEFMPNGDRKNPKFAIYNAKTGVVNENGDLVWTPVGKVELNKASFYEEVCFPKPSGCGDIEDAPDDTYPDEDRLPVLLVAAMAILGLLFLAVAFKYWRSRKSKKSIKAELVAFQKSIVDAKAAACNYIPHVATKSTIDPKEQALTALSVTAPLDVRWCWKETATLLKNHNPSAFYGDPADCWIPYTDEQNRVLEAACCKAKKLLM
jgi:Receptor family ligand binding region